jgi:hypothetical protein
LGGPIEIPIPIPIPYSDDKADLNINESAGVTLTVVTGTTSGWSATAYHNGTARTCAIFYGSGASPEPPATKEGEPACT